MRLPIPPPSLHALVYIIEGALSAKSTLYPPQNPQKNQALPTIVNSTASPALASFKSGHYENFPVASVLLPRKLRHPVQVIYAFARSADDFADEGDAADTVRLANLENYRTQLRHIEADETSADPLFQALAEIIQAHALPLQPFYDLLDAFSQDVTTKRYATFYDLMDYCRRSANPVGTLMLHLYEQATPENMLYSDAICSALQLINFWQDVEIDFAKARVYIPLEDLHRFHVSEKNIAEKNVGAPFQDLMQFEIRRARNLLLEGKPLGRILKGRIGLEMRMIIQGGLRILDLLEKHHGDVFHHRPKLKTADWFIMAARAL